MQANEQTPNTNAKASEFNPLEFDTVVVSVAELAQGGDNASKLADLMAWAEEHKFPIYANYDLSEDSSGVPEGFEVVGSVYTAGRGENAEAKGAMVVCVPTLETVLAAPDGREFASDKVRKNHILKVQTAIRADASNPSLPKYLNDFLATRRTANEGLQNAKQAAKGTAAWLTGRGMKISTEMVLACWRSRKHSEAMYNEDLDNRVFKASLARWIDQYESENKDVSQLVSWRDTRDTYDPAAQLEDLNLDDLDFSTAA